MSYNDLRSGDNDCKELAHIINSGIKGKIDFSWNVYGQIMGGRYNCLLSKDDTSFEFEIKEREQIKFSYKFLKDGFLRIGVGNNPLSKKTVGHKLAALSDFYQVLSKNFGEPTLFYTMENDDEEYLYFEWVFIDKKETIEEFKNNTFFDDGGKVKNLIIIGEQQDKFISNQLGLPIELLGLVEENIDDYIKYKQIDVNNTDEKESTEKTKVMTI